MNASASTPVRVGKLSGLKVLVVEDLWLHADTMSVILEGEGATVLGPFSTADEAIAEVRRAPPDFALVDMNLGGVFADDLVLEMAQRSIPYAIITAYRSLPTNADADAVGVLRKPINAKAIIDLMSRWLRERSP